MLWIVFTIVTLDIRTHPSGEATMFSYRTLLGDLLFVYVCARPDISYSHYHYLKGIAKYPRRTICWKIYYTKPQPDPS
jgi:hypothetical protein